MPGKGKPFTKGEPRINREGRPPEPWSWSGLLREVAEQELKGKEKKKWIADALFKEALKGNMAAVKEFGDRIDGKAKQETKVEHSGSVSLTDLYDSTQEDE